MALRAATVVAKTLLAEEGENVLATAVRMVRTTAIDEAGITMQSSETVGMVSRSVMDSGTVAGHAVEEGMVEASKISEITPKAPKEFQVNTPREVELPGTKNPEVQPGHYQGEKRELDLKSPKEFSFPDPKTVPEVKPGENVQIKSMEKEAEFEKKEEEIVDNIAKNVPVDPSNINPVMEQARRNERPEVGAVRTTVEVGRDNRRQESTEDGQRQLDVNAPSGGPEVGRNPLNEQI